MHDLTFQMQLSCTYNADSNNVSKLEVENLVDGEWKALELTTTSPGFDIFIYSLFTCQHMYFRLNAAESKLVLKSSKGKITIGTDKQRVIQKVHVEFEGVLASGNVTESNVAYIKERMRACPVSINLRDIEENTSSIHFIS